MAVLLINECKKNLRVAVQNEDLIGALRLAKLMGLSMRYICRLSDCNPSNVSSYIRGSSNCLSVDSQQRLLNTIKGVLLHGK